MENKSNKRILIIDDDVDILQALSVKLKKQGYTVLEAKDGISGLDRLKKELPDMVMVDVHMPDIDGFEFCRQAASLSEKKHIPIMVMTAQDDQDSVNKAYEEGATDFITKPINYAKLEHRLRFLLRTSEMAEKLVNRECQLLAAQNIAKMGEWVYDIETKEFKCSDAVAKIFAIDKEAISSYEDLMSYVIDEDIKDIDSVLENVDESQKYYNFEYSIKAGDGVNKRIRQIIDINIDDPIMSGKVFGIFQDVSQIREAEQKVKTLSLYDSLTNLPNRQFFKRILKKTIASSERYERRFALLDVNLDNFMRINTNLGHDVGDKLLFDVSQRLSQTLRDSDEISRDCDQEITNSCLLAHLGGDNFVLLLTDINSADAAAVVARRIQNIFETTFHIADDEIHLSVSIGISLYPDDGLDVDEMLKKVSIALHNAKQTGRNCYRFYTEEMNTLTFQRLSMENSLRKAIVRQQFVLYYQPKISLLDNKIAGAEALIRWNHPDMGMVSPADFIPLAETTGLIVPMTDWVIVEACRQLGQWRRNGLTLESVAINITPASLLDKNINEHIFKNLQLAGVEAKRLDFEITESVLMDDVDVILPILKELRDFGATISIDDFGTGYSSLSYLKRLPISKLKIDKSFILDLMQDKDNAIIVKSVINLAHNLGLRVIAEGVEQSEQLEYLKEHGCDVIQGYYYSRPLPAKEFQQWVMKYEEERINAEQAINIAS